MGAQRSEGGQDCILPDVIQQQHQPWNLMIKHRQIHRRGRRSHMTVNYTDPQVSMDLFRAVLQSSFNKDITAVFTKYQKLLQRAADNVKENVKEVQTDQLINETARSLLENAKHMFPETDGRKMGPEVAPKRAKAADEDFRDSPLIKKRKIRVGAAVVSDRQVTFSSQVKAKAEVVKREGPKWDPSRLNENSTFVLGSRANKALGMGGTRGRIYIKHADLFKYAADAKDKQWLAERHHMRATGGKMAYLLIEEDIQDLAHSDEYRECPELRMDELKPFSVPPWMVEKMQRAMEAQRDSDL
ncbi:deoxynucleotidyltransferase terminal-interacting protein 1 isoform X2 [Synchiropus splendidus]|uniref:deoxynucleotidyltransferase terminal-interacting protein 1 isoform X2 n=1 Tax=Synchiropus splendidus TaxID=270530 RepID=UPI00237E0A91|nr:deoxynucleotidyltransferase terminal-interacting protein 1 isoform X2 [Synchiropus splendidus]